MMTASNVISIATRKPIQNVRQVIIADPPDRLPTFMELRANVGLEQAVRACNTAYRALDHIDRATVEIARLTLHNLADDPDGYPQVRNLARMFISISEKPKPNGAA